MATNYKGEGDIVTLIAPGAGFTSGTPVLQAGKLVLPLKDGDSGDSVACAMSGIWYVTKTSGVTIAEGEPAYFNSTSDEFTNVDDASNRQVGYFTKVAANLATVAYVFVENRGTAGNEDISNKMDKVSGGVTDNLVSLSATDNAADSGISKDDVATMAAVGTAGNLIMSSAADKTQQDSLISAGDVPTMAAVGGAGNLVGTAAADRAQSDSGVVIADVVENATGAAGGADYVITSAAADKTVKDSTTLLSALATDADLASNANAKGASLIGIEDSAGEYAATDVEGALFEVRDEAVQYADLKVVEVVIALGAAAGSSGADATNVGWTITSCVPTQTNDQIVASVAMDGTGAITVTVTANETAEAKFNVFVTDL